MTKYVYRNGFHFIGKFNELIQQLSSIENKHVTLADYIKSYNQKLN